MKYLARKEFLSLLGIATLSLISFLTGCSESNGNSTETHVDENAQNKNIDEVSNQEIPVIVPIYTIDDFDALQRLFCSISYDKTREEIDADIEWNHLFVTEFKNGRVITGYYIGNKQAAIRERGRDRQGYAIDVSFSKDGKVTSASYKMHDGDGGTGIELTREGFAVKTYYYTNDKKGNQKQQYNIEVYNNPIEAMCVYMTFVSQTPKLAAFL